MPACRLFDPDNLFALDCNYRGEWLTWLRQTAEEYCLYAEPRAANAKNVNLQHVKAREQAARIVTGRFTDTKHN